MSTSAQSLAGSVRPPPLIERLGQPFVRLKGNQGYPDGGDPWWSRNERRADPSGLCLRSAAGTSGDRRVGGSGPTVVCAAVAGDPPADRVPGRRVGLLLWHAEEPACRWPAWQVVRTGAVAGLHAPLGAGFALGSASATPDPAALVQRLRQCPADPAFVRAAATQTAAQSTTNALHDPLIARLTPAWADIPYFHATLRQRGAARRPKLWEQDPDRLATVIATPTTGATPSTSARCRRCGVGPAPAGPRAATSSCCNGSCGGRPSPTILLPSTRQPPAGARQSRTFHPAGRGLPDIRFGPSPSTANEIGLARKFGRTRAGRWLRRVIGV